LTTDLSLQELWNSAPPGEGDDRVPDLSRLPEAARRYLEHAIASGTRLAPGTRLARAVRLRMHGEIKLRRWYPFRAEQVIVWNRGFIWSATVRMSGMPIRGSDRLVDGEGAMRWRLLGLIPIMTASGPDIRRSAAGRVAAEAVWLPSVLCGDDVSWVAPDPSRLHAAFASDAAAHAIARTGDLLAAHGASAKLAVADMTVCPWPQVRFHGVLSWDSLHHNTVEGTRQAISTVYDQLVEGGLFLATLKSTKADSFGRGHELEPSTYVRDDGDEAGVPHHYSVESEVRSLFARWDLLVLVEQVMDYRERGEQFLEINVFPYTRWGILAKKRYAKDSPSS